MSNCVILVPVAYRLEPQTHESLRALEKSGYELRLVYDRSGIDEVRSEMATDALAEGFEELLWVDSDMVFDAAAVDQLRSHQLPIVGTAAALKGKQDIACHLLPDTHEMTFGKAGGLLEVFYTGTGFLLTHRKVYEDIRERTKLPECELDDRTIVPYFMPTIIPDARGYWYLGEDYAFCDRARTCGYKIHVDTSIHIGHMGTRAPGWGPPPDKTAESLRVNMRDR